MERSPFFFWPFFDSSLVEFVLIVAAIESSWLALVADPPISLDHSSDDR